MTKVGKAALAFVAVAAVAVAVVSGGSAAPQATVTAMAGGHRWPSTRSAGPKLCPLATIRSLARDYSGWSRRRRNRERKRMAYQVTSSGMS